MGVQPSFRAKVQGVVQTPSAPPALAGVRRKPSGTDGARPAGAGANAMGISEAARHASYARKATAATAVSAAAMPGQPVGSRW